MASRFVIQVVDRHTNAVVSWAPGSAVERQFVEDLVDRVVAKGVGFGRTSAHVAGDVRAAVENLLFELKRDVPPSR